MVVQEIFLGWSLRNLNHTKSNKETTWILQKHTHTHKNTWNITILFVLTKWKKKKKKRKKKKRLTRNKVEIENWKCWNENNKVTTTIS